ncbi:hypothetical protein GUJ93_ZPchr0008g13002 [Zizania palustris]|uniref:Uncharacterized protein n=1 Tax=Zizania palustris TaxID=103762 RepID=A0A8J5V1P1_ZIZPA|nr:hypothetical protein GUJ93_ZPchr0008g13002 [Zizania palustris]
MLAASLDLAARRCLPRPRHEPPDVEKSTVYSSYNGSPTSAGCDAMDSVVARCPLAVAWPQICRRRHPPSYIRPDRPQSVGISPNYRVVVTQVKTVATDGYDVVQLEYHGVRDDKLTRPELGHLGKAVVPLLSHVQESRIHPCSSPSRSRGFVASPPFSYCGILQGSWRI